MIPVPKGFSFSGIHAGIKPSRKDLALVLSDRPCAAAGCFTANRAKAAPVLHAQRVLPEEGIRAIVINSGNANALTGEQGLADVDAVIAAAAKAFSVGPAAVLTASTGVIGHRLPVQKITDALARLADARKPEAELAAEAMMTTDTQLKVASRTLPLGGASITLSGVCKGSGMIHPELATMICVVTTDCAIHPQALDQALKQSMPTTFNSLTVDGDMSTNDCVLALANGAAGNRRIVGVGKDLSAFQTALQDVCADLAQQIAQDGEGATKKVEVAVDGAPSAAAAQDLARAVASSNLVKAALFGADPNWGRVLAALGARAGTKGYPVEPARARVTIQGIGVFDRGPTPHEPALLRARMREPSIHIHADLRAGDGHAVAWGCDLSYDYVKINADYSSLIVPAPDGSVSRDNRLTHYSPGFKSSLLVEALSYISRFAGKRCVVSVGAPTLSKESLKRSFCQDIELLRSVGLKPLVLHGTSAETASTDPRAMEMMSTGGVNAELVTLLNREAARAVGTSGKDGAMLRAASDGRLLEVNKEFLELLLKQDYVPVVSPVGLVDGGQTVGLDGDEVAAEVARATGAAKLILLVDGPGLCKGDELCGQFTRAELEAFLPGVTSAPLRRQVRAALRALDGGVQQVHFVDGRTPHSLIAELFTDSGVGTLVRA